MPYFGGSIETDEIDKALNGKTLEPQKSCHSTNCNTLPTSTSLKQKQTEAGWQHTIFHWLAITGLPLLACCLASIASFAREVVVAHHLHHPLSL